MGLQDIHKQEMGLILFADNAKPRLKWTPELHNQFVQAVNQLGGAHKATPKGLMRVMGVPGLTLHHLKSHLQKYRLGKRQESGSCSDFKQTAANCIHGLHNDTATQDDTKENVWVTHAIHMQMESQQKLNEELKIQRHVQLRIEAQEKYLEKVLKRAQEALSGCSSSDQIPVAAKSEAEENCIEKVRCSDESSVTSLGDSGNEEIANFSRDDITPGERKRAASMALDADYFEQTSSKRSESLDLNCKHDHKHCNLD